MTYFRPKKSSSALEARVLAEKLNVRNLLLYHTEDKNLATRKNDYAEEAQRYFKGKVIVPNDLEVISI